MRPCWTSSSRKGKGTGNGWSVILTQEYRHEPVMLGEVLESLRLKSGSVVCDCTLGGAGHSVKMAAQVGRGLCSASIRTIMALEPLAPVWTARFRRSAPAAEGQLRRLGRAALLGRGAGVDGFLFDLGVSSPQLDILAGAFRITRTPH